ncbi:HdeD family acid-resistance protein [Limosilactobacillus difficilis]|uniref:HdeD family acid-resistance protein n=1 Tax=Limosilactobacillus difficilis TaxID=2991838 RepID=UPI0024BABD56|nr:DUF308 domain-containing protein [Limosilactobacillus difficilis]
MFSAKQPRPFSWGSLILGILLIVLGCVSLSHPDKTMHLLTILVAVGLLVRGLFELWCRIGIQDFLGFNTGWLLAMAIVDIILGIAFLFFHNFGSTVIVYIFAFWFLFDAIADVSLISVYRRFHGTGWIVLMIIFSILQFIVAITMLFQPMLSAMMLVWLVSFYLIVAGILKVIQTF